MNQLKKLKKEIKGTLDYERSCLVSGYEGEDNQRGWIEALEYCISQIELLESSANQNSDLK